MKVRYTTTASRELDQAVEYLLQHAPHVAPAFADSVESAIAELVENPLSAQETEQPGVRRKHIRRFRYALFYSVSQDAGELLVLNIRHAARRWPWEAAHRG
ncbi:MAG: type II toxin-antitoxin system RelE/ParE family toxin [Xanthobacteraceae bacterium]|nr:type II toxin-antitoxin system RelE/ParE family toxin [Xanthobacteraceae bacterium]